MGWDGMGAERDGIDVAAVLALKAKARLPISRLYLHLSLPLHSTLPEGHSLSTP